MKYVWRQTVSVEITPRGLRMPRIDPRAIPIDLRLPVTATSEFGSSLSGGTGVHAPRHTFQSLSRVRIGSRLSRFQLDKYAYPKRICAMCSCFASCPIGFCESVVCRKGVQSASLHYVALPGTTLYCVVIPGAILYFFVLPGTTL